MSRELFPSQALASAGRPGWDESSADHRDQNPEYRLIHQMARPAVRHVFFIPSHLARWMLGFTGGKSRSRLAGRAK